MGALRKDRSTSHEFFNGKHRFEHWYRDNSVYFITTSCRDHFPAFRNEEAKSVFWDRFSHYTQMHGFEPWVISLLNNHYHVIGYIRDAKELGQMMRKLHGAAAKMVNDLLPQRHLPFWRERGGRDYFDGCLRDEKQFRGAYRYTLMQSVRHGICADYRDYSHTRVFVTLEEGLKFAIAHHAFLENIPYARYER